MITPETHHRINTFYRSLDKVLSEMQSRFDSNDQQILCALGDVVLNEHPSVKGFEVVAKLLEFEQSMYENSVNNDISSRAKTAAPIVERMFQNGLFDVLPVLNEVATTLASAPATSR